MGIFVSPKMSILKINNSILYKPGFISKTNIGNKKGVFSIIVYMIRIKQLLVDNSPNEEH